MEISSSSLGLTTRWTLEVGESAPLLEHSLKFGDCLTLLGCSIEEEMWHGGEEGKRT